ncbi:hypothetical protein C8R43DRAFT_1141554 [Mycena crocata]|nr:hypothetical protein C8R43DRAFT_1141554 [Mycena crocata]
MSTLPCRLPAHLQSLSAGKLNLTVPLHTPPPALQRQESLHSAPAAGMIHTDTFTYQRSTRTHSFLPLSHGSSTNESSCEYKAMLVLSDDRQHVPIGHENGAPVKCADIPASPIVSRLEVSWRKPAIYEQYSCRVTPPRWARRTTVVPVVFWGHPAHSPILSDYYNLDHPGHAGKRRPFADVNYNEHFDSEEPMQRETKVRVSKFSVFANLVFNSTPDFPSFDMARPGMIPALLRTDFHLLITLRPAQDI